MTKEQREYVAEHLRNLIGYDESTGEDSDIPAFRAALALLSDDEAEADRKLGAAVRNYLIEKEIDARLAEALALIIDAADQPEVAELFRVIACALREESR